MYDQERELTIRLSPERTLAEEFVFLGGTAGKSTWRNVFMQLIADRDPSLIGKFFDPVVPESKWNDGAKDREDKAKNNAFLHLYYITNPETPESPASFYSMIEAQKRSFTHPDSTIIVFDRDAKYEGTHIKKQVDASKQLIENNPQFSLLLPDLESAADLLCQKLREPTATTEKTYPPLTLADRWHALKVKRLLLQRMRQSGGDSAVLINLDYHIGGKAIQRNAIAAHVAKTLTNNRRQADYRQSGDKDGDALVVYRKH
jgi:hypothetical protein